MYTILVIRSNQKFIKSYQYQTPGVYTIRVTATNLQGNTSAEHEIVVEHPVLGKQWKLTNNSPKLLPEAVRFGLSYPEEFILPSNATLLLNFGDNKRHIWKIPEYHEDWSGEYEISHVYEKSGVYNVIVEISNVVSKIQKQFQVDVLRRIVGLEVKATRAIVNSSQPDTINQDTSSTDLLPVGSTINLMINQEIGDVEYYLVHMNDELYKNTTQNGFNVTFIEVIFHPFFLWSSSLY